MWFSAISTSTSSNSSSPNSSTASPSTTASKAQEVICEDSVVSTREISPAGSGNIGSVLPRDRPFWIQLPDGEPRPDKLEGISGEEAIVVSADRERKGLFNQADRALAVLVPDADPDDIEYHDDASWEHFPAIGTALKAIADQAECMCVATCISRDVWAVGVGMNIGEASYLPRQDVFLLGAECNRAYVVSQGVASYTEHVLGVASSVSVTLESFSWLAEMALYVHWTHCGQLSAKTGCSFALLEVPRFQSVIAKHGGPCYVTLKRYVAFLVGQVEKSTDHLTDLPLDDAILEKVVRRVMSFDTAAKVMMKKGMSTSDPSLRR